MQREPEMPAADPVLASYVAAVKEDPDTFGVLLHGSREQAALLKRATTLLMVGRKRPS